MMFRCFNGMIMNCMGCWWDSCEIIKGSLLDVNGNLIWEYDMLLDFNGNMIWNIESTSFMRFGTIVDCKWGYNTDIMRM